MKKLVSVNFKQNISVEIAWTEDTELLYKRIHEAVAKQIKEKMPSYNYSIADVDVLTMDTAKIGSIVKVDGNKIGVILGINKKTINVAVNNGVLQGAPENFKLANDVDVEDIQFERTPMEKELNRWYEGKTGYMKTKEGIKHVIIGSSKGKATKVFILGTSLFYTLDEGQLKMFIKDTKDLV